jgi:hypothetical protein
MAGDTAPGLLEEAAWLLPLTLLVPPAATSLGVGGSSQTEI